MGLKIPLHVILQTGAGEVDENSLGGERDRQSSPTSQTGRTCQEIRFGTHGLVVNCFGTHGLVVNCNGTRLRPPNTRNTQSFGRGTSRILCQ